MKNNITELVFVIDRSGSMWDLTADTIGGFNSMLKKSADGEGKVLVTTYLFNDNSIMIYDRTPIEDVKPMTDKDYCPSGCTALVDALGSAIKHIVGIHRYARPEDVPEHTVFIITTDGMENASTKFSAEEVRRMVSHEQEKYGWEFIFLASNIDAVETASHYGIKANRAVDCCPDAAGTEMLYESACMSFQAIQNGFDLDKDTNWRAKIDSDFKRRGKSKK